MIYPHEQFAIEHMGWKPGEPEPTEQEIIDATQKHWETKIALRESIAKKLSMTVDEVTAIFA
jgi:hypothetical protein